MIELNKRPMVPIIVGVRDDFYLGESSVVVADRLRRKLQPYLETRGWKGVKEEIRIEPALDGSSQGFVTLEIITDQLQPEVTLGDFFGGIIKHGT